MSLPDFTVAIPCYNGARRLPALLDRLREQIGIDGLAWEVLIIDNNSTDDTVNLVRTYGQNPDLPYTLRYSFEPEQGAAFARQRAIREARTELVGFLDDDIIPDRDWLRSAYQFGQRYPHAAAYGGEIRAQFDAPPPPNFDRISSFLALRHYADTPTPYDPENLRLPPSASWAIRRQAWLDCVPPRPSLAGRSNGSMLQGDDYEPLMYLHRAGWEIWYEPAMRVTHHIPPQRLERQYLLDIACGSCLCIYNLRTIGRSRWEKPIIFAKIVGGSLKRAIAHVLRHRQRAFTDTALRCQLEQHLCSARSPFFCTWISLFHRR